MRHLALLVGVCAWLCGAQALGQAPDNSNLRDFYLPAQLPARMVFDLDSGNASQIWTLRLEGKYLVTERVDIRQRLLEYQRELLNENGAFVESYATYTRDSSGRSTPLFAEIGSPDLFYWPWPAGQKAVFSYLEPRRMDERMGAIRVERERLVLPEIDSVLFNGQKVAVRFVNDLVRLSFMDRNGEPIGEDTFLEFRRYAKGLGLIGFTRQFSDGKTLNGRRQED
ncbi:MAG: hypothetical protein GC205_00650 [Bacteroidetes bacterium]|nr:hypothetical protein [Bacteroidota bacterium]